MLTVALALVLSVPSTPYTWRSVQIVGGGFVSGVITHPTAKDVVYARTDIGGAYRWEQRLRRWVPIQDWITRSDWNLYGVESLALDPNDPNRVYIAAGTYTNQWGGPGAILRSSDRGKTWARTNLPFKNGGNEDGRSIGERLAVDPKDGRHLLFGTRHNGLWSSSDRGRTWSEVTTFPSRAKALRHGIGIVAFHRNTVYAGLVANGASLLQSSDSGKTWVPVPGQPEKYTPHHLAFGSSGEMVVTYSNAPGPNGATDGAVFKRSANGEWRDITPLRPEGKETFGYGGVSVDAKHSGTMIVSTLDRWGKDTLYRSTDGGASWKSLAELAVRDSKLSPFLNWGRPGAEFGHWIGDCEIDPNNPNRAWYVTGATIWRTDDLTKADKGQPTHWNVNATGIEETAVLKLISPPVGAQVISALGDIGGFAHSDLTRSPRSGMITNPLLATVNDIDFAEHVPHLIVRVGTSYEGTQHGGFSQDGGKTWKPLANDPPQSRGGGSVAVSADGKTILWAPFGGSASLTTDFGTTWETCSGAPRNCRLIADREDPSLFYAYDTNAGWLYMSHDSGKSFARQYEVPTQDEGSPVAVFGKRGHLWLPSKAGLFRSSDSAKSWTKLAGVTEARTISFGRALHPGGYPTLYIVGTISATSGVFRSTDEGKHWTQINDAETGFGTMNWICGDPKLFGRVYLGTNGRGVLFADPKHR